jgi:hypothetical protein
MREIPCLAEELLAFSRRTPFHGVGEITHTSGEDRMEGKRWLIE